MGHMSFKHWRCWPIFQTVLPFGWLWPLVGHCIRIWDGYAYCDRCDWRERLPAWPT